MEKLLLGGRATENIGMYRRNKMWYSFWCVNLSRYWTMYTTLPKKSHSRVCLLILLLLLLFVCFCKICTNRNESVFLLVELCTSVTLSQHTTIRNTIHFSCWSYYAYYFIGVLPSPVCLVHTLSRIIVALLLFFSFGFCAC